MPAEDSNRLWFLWWPNGDFSQNIGYRMLVHLFGQDGIRRQAVQILHFKSVQNYAADTILHSFYVYDCLASVASESQAAVLYYDLRAICARGGFQLRKWISNSRSVLVAIPEEERAKEVILTMTYFLLKEHWAHSGVSNPMHLSSR